MENKWWEYYVVRYFVGTIVGAVIIVFLVGQPARPYSELLTSFANYKESTFLGVSLVAALGFAFCYIASSPMLTMHTARAHFQMSVLKKHCLLHLASILIPVGIAVYIAWQSLSQLAAIVIGVIIGGQIGMVAAMLVNRLSSVESFYRELATARSMALAKKDDPATPGMEYITSYRHLREHGNAFAIVFLEIVLAWALYQLCSVTDLLYLFMAWLLPAIFSWVVGTVLESRYVSSPL